MDIHNFYLVKVKDKKILENNDVYINLLKNVTNDDFCILDKIDIEDDFLSLLSNFLIFLPNDTPYSINEKRKFGLNFYGITILKNGKILYNIFDSLYNIFNSFEDEFYMLYTDNSLKLIDKETYTSLNIKQNCSKLYKKDVIYTFEKLKNFSLKLEEDNYFVVHLGI